MTVGKAEDRGVFAKADIFLFEDFRLDGQGDGLLRRNERGVFVFVPVPIGLCRRNGSRWCRTGAGLGISTYSRKMAR